MDVAASTGLIFILFIIYKSVNVLRHIVQARRTGLPYTLTWTLETETVGYILTPILRWKYHDYLLKGKGWPSWCRLMIKDWSFEDKRRAHDEYGEVFLAVSPEGIICYACDAAMGWDVMNRRNEFLKPRDKYKLLEIYGPNVTTTEGSTYRFHVRIVAPPFADGSGANELVWEETKNQTRRLMDSWHQQASSSVQLDINGLTLAVIAKAGFGRDLEWTTGGKTDQLPPGHRITFLEAMTSTMINMIPVLLLPRWLLYMSPLRNAAISHSEFETYVREMIREEKSKISDSGAYQSASARGNLLTSVLRASADNATAAAKIEDGVAHRKPAFTETEVMGNLFLYLLAGYETTANAILYGLICLALYPDIQDQAIEEVDRLCAEVAKQGRLEFTYRDDFEKFEYLYGFMYETLRLFPAPQQITKMVPGPTTIHVSPPHGGHLEPVLLPTQCRVYLNVPAVHHTERYWPDPYRLDPCRWMKTPITSSKSNDGNQNHSITKTAVIAAATAATNERKIVAADKNRHMQGTFLTFSDGARACLGRKFAQAEYVAFFVTMLREFRVELRHDGVDQKAEVERKIFSRCKGTLTLAPGDDVGMVLRKRKL